MYWLDFDHVDVSFFEGLTDSFYADMIIDTSNVIDGLLNLIIAWKFEDVSNGSKTMD